MPEPYRPEEREHEDARWMRQALGLAEASIGLASPNPCVGCVLVKDGKVVGRGAHHYDTRDHAEVVALADAGTEARNATAYVTLEPCSHTGRTPPCAESLLKAGVARVVVATGDPNPLVNGRGVGILREAGVAVTVGVLAEQARTLNDGFARWIRRGLPFVTLKAAVSLDGRIAPASSQKRPGTVAYLTGARSLMAVQKIRHAADAVLTGIGTALADDPLLTDRSEGLRRRPLLRVVLDSALRLPLVSRLVQTAHDDLLVFTARTLGEEASRARRQALEGAGVQIRVAHSSPGNGLDLHDVLRQLGGEFQVLNLLVEGGSHLNRALLAGDAGSQAADKLCLFYAPIFLGEGGVPLIAGEATLPVEARRAAISASGIDFRLDAYLRDPWRDL